MAGTDGLFIADGEAFAVCWLRLAPRCRRLRFGGRCSDGPLACGEGGGRGPDRKIGNAVADF